MTPLKRAMIGGRVVLDATGTGDMVYGTIFDATESGKLHIRPVDGSETITAVKSVLFKPTDAEWKAALDAASVRDAQLAQDAEIEQQDIEVPVLLAESMDQAVAEQGAALRAEKPAAAAPRTLDQIEEDSRKNGAVDPHYLGRYRKARNAKGNTGYNCGDEVAARLEGKDLDECFDIVEQITGTDYSGHWSKLNPGMRRMNLGNALRRWYKAQESK